MFRMSLYIFPCCSVHLTWLLICYLCNCIAYRVSVINFSLLPNYIASNMARLTVCTSTEHQFCDCISSFLITTQYRLHFRNRRFFYMFTCYVYTCSDFLQIYNLAYMTTFLKSLLIRYPHIYDVYVFHRYHWFRLKLFHVCCTCGESRLLSVEKFSFFGSGSSNVEKCTKINGIFSNLCRTTCSTPIACRYVRYRPEWSIKVATVHKNMINGDRFTVNSGPSAILCRVEGNDYCCNGTP